MKKSRIIFIALICLTQFLYAKEAKFMERFQVANSYYQNRDYQKAIEEYESLINEGFQSGELFYNLGCAYYRIGKMGKSILNLERAKKIMPRDEDILYNLDYIYTINFGKKDQSDQNLITRILIKGYNLFSLNETAWIIWVIYLISMTLMIVAVFIEKASFKKLVKYSLIPLCFFFILFSFSLYLKVKDEIFTQYGIIMVDTANLLSGPAEGNEITFHAREGSKVVIQRELGDFYLVKNPELGYRGWIHKNEVEVI